jgi:hypothetical protein
MRRWSAIAAGSLAVCTLSFGIAPVLLAAGTAQAAVSSAAPLITTSPSWAGYYLAGADGAYSSVSSSWTVPSATCVSGSQYASFWVGLDGYSSDSVEQIGIDEDCSGGTASLLGWYDMYPASPVYFDNTIDAGDSMSASVTFSGTTTYTLVLQDATQGWTQTVVKSEAGLSRSSAEIVTEGPGAGGVLTDFGKITYSACKVNGTSMGTQDPTSITMVDSKGKTMVSPSTMTSAGKFTNTWLRGT